MSCNPDDPNAPVQQFIDGKRPDTAHVHVIWSDNPFFPSVLEAERAYLQSVDADAYSHVWLGTTRTHSEACVFKGKYFIEEFEPVLAPKYIDPYYAPPNAEKPWDGPYFGADWGFSQDPTTCIKCWIHERTLYIEHEAYALGCDIDRTPALFDTIPGARDYKMRADNARPETISYMQQNGYRRIEPCRKWTGSVEDGIAFLRSFERIVLHPSCVRAAEEFRLYSYRVDRLTGDVLTDLADKHNHLIDALRYAVEPAIRRRGEARIFELRI